MGFRFQTKLLGALAIGGALGAGALALSGCGEEAGTDTAEAGNETGAGDSGGDTGSGDGAGSDGAGGSDPGTDAGTDNTAATGPDAFIPAPSGECPEFAEGTVEFTVDGKSRKAEIWMSDAAKTKSGPVIFFWHGLGSTPNDTRLFGTLMNPVKALGGIFVGPYSDPSSGMFPWYMTAGSGKDDDMRFADEVLACAKEKLAIDTRQIHSTGFSAGALQAVQFAIRRSGYIASVVSWSGGLIGSMKPQDPDNLYSAMLFHGGETDERQILFKGITETLDADLKAAGHYTLLCDHGGGHTLPNDSIAATWRFMQDHPYGTTPSPYAAKLPETMPSYCK